MLTERMEVKFPQQNTFTFKDLEKMNPDMSPQTLRLRLKQSLDEGEVTRSAEVVANTGKRGRAQHIYIHGSSSSLSVENS